MRHVVRSDDQLPPIIIDTAARGEESGTRVFSVTSFHQAEKTPSSRLIAPCAHAEADRL